MTERHNEKAKRIAKLRRESESEEGGIGKLILSCAKSVLLCAAGAAVLLTAVGYLVYLYPDPDRLILPAGLLLLVIISLACGFTACRINGGGGLLCGVIAGAILLVIMTAVSLSIGGDKIPGWLRVCEFAIPPVVSGVGGMLGVKREPKRPRRKRTA